MCDCIEKTNKALAAHNMRLDVREAINFKTNRISRVLTIPTCKINSRIRKPMHVLIVSFCPMCGEKRDTAATDAINGAA